MIYDGDVSTALDGYNLQKISLLIHSKNSGNWCVQVAESCTKINGLPNILYSDVREY